MNPSTHPPTTRAFGKQARKQAGKHILLAVFLLMVLCARALPVMAEPANPSTKTTVKPAVKTETKVDTKSESKKEAKTSADSNKKYVVVQPADLLKAPQKYLNQPVQFEGTFNSFSILGLDYKKAFRDSRDYVSLMINRPDVKDYTIPMSELKMFYPRSKSESVLQLEAGNKVVLKGTVFSTALNEPWLDVDAIDIVDKPAEKTAEKPADKSAPSAAKSNAKPKSNP